MLVSSTMFAAEHRVTSPDGRLGLIVSDDASLCYRVEIDGATLVSSSSLGLEFKDGTRFGPSAKVSAAVADKHDAIWKNHYGQRLLVQDRWNQLTLTLSEVGTDSRSISLTMRAYDDGVAFRYGIPKAPGLDEFIITKELTEFCFSADHSCWVGGESLSSEVNYTERPLSQIPRITGDGNRAGQPYRGVLPLLVRTPAGYIAITESDLRDWAGMHVTGTGGTTVQSFLAPRSDGRGAVVGKAPMQSPWRVFMFGKKAADLVASDLVATLATPNQIGDDSWVKPGITAWDVWWTGMNPTVPQFTGIDARGDTRSHKEYIDFASEMGWPYQIVDWYWYQNMTSYTKSLLSPPNNPSGDFRKTVDFIDLPDLVSHARKKKVGLWIWAHSLDMEQFGVEKALKHFADVGVVGLKIDFIDSDTQEAVQWCEKTLALAAKYRLMVNFHGIFKPTGLARTYPNFLTQEGVLGNEYNKFGNGACTISHTVTLPFTRGLLGPMDFTPGGFLNVKSSDFKITVPAQVMGSRCRQLAMAVIYRSPLLVMCDSPAHYRDQPGIDFFKGLPTVWEETVVLEGEVGKSIAIARKAKGRWYVAAMNGETPLKLDLPLGFLGKGKWSLHGFADNLDGALTDVVRSSRQVDATGSLTIDLNGGGGFAGVITPSRQ